MTTSTAKVLPSGQLSLKDRLSRLTFSEACTVLGPEGRQLICQRHLNTWEFKLREHVFLGPDLFACDSPPIPLMGASRRWSRSRCWPRSATGFISAVIAAGGACEHVGAAFSLILEEKLALGLRFAAEAARNRSKAWPKMSCCAGLWRTAPSGRDRKDVGEDD